MTGEIFAAALAQINAAPPLNEATRDKLVTALEGIQLTDTIYGPLKFATDGNWYHNNTGLKPLTIQIRDGQQTIVGPKELKLKDPAYPVPGFGQR
jgi:branched-chain amino acid transport system substrate-binding protein